MKIKLHAIALAIDEQGTSSSRHTERRRSALRHTETLLKGLRLLDIPHSDHPAVHERTGNVCPLSF